MSPISANTNNLPLHCIDTGICRGISRKKPLRNFSKAEQISSRARNRRQPKFHLRYPRCHWSYCLLASYNNITMLDRERNVFFLWCFLTIFHVLLGLPYPIPASSAYCCSKASSVCHTCPIATKLPGPRQDGKAYQSGRDDIQGLLLRFLCSLWNSWGNIFGNYYITIIIVICSLIY